MTTPNFAEVCAGGKNPSPNVDGWRAPNQPRQADGTYVCCSPQQYRSWDGENLVWGMQTIVTPLLQALTNNGQVSGTKTTSATLQHDATVADYAAKQVIANDGGDPYLEVAMLLNAAGEGFLVGIKATTNEATQSGAIKLHFFNAVPQMGMTDYDPFDLKFVDSPNYLGAVALPVFTTEGAGSDMATAQVVDIRLPLKSLVFGTIYVVAMSVGVVDGFANMAFDFQFTTVQ